MPQIVELIGPSGTGKTAIYNAIKNKWNPEYNWVVYDDLNYSGRAISGARLNALKRKITRFLFPFKNRKRTQMNADWKFIDYSNRTYLGDEYSELKSGLMDLVEAHCSKSYAGRDNRFNTIYMLMWSIAHLDRVQAAENDDRYCILKQGEGFVSRIMHLNSPSFNEKALDRFMQIIPLPDVIVYLDVPLPEIMHRIKTRNRLSSIHKGMNEETIEGYTENTMKYLNKASEIAEQKGVRVQRIDATKAIDDSASEIITYLSNL